MQRCSMALQQPRGGVRRQRHVAELPGLLAFVTNLGATHLMGVFCGGGVVPPIRAIVSMHPSGIFMPG
jgi:hypothetical protein